MSNNESKDVYHAPAADLFDSDSTEQKLYNIKAQERRLKKNNLTSAAIFIALGAGVFYVCDKISSLIIGAGKTYEVPIEDVTKAIEPYSNLQTSIVPFVMVGLVAYINFIIGNAKTGIYLMIITIVIAIFLLFYLSSEIKKEDIYTILLLSPIVLVALNSIRVNYARVKSIKSGDVENTP